MIMCFFALFFMVSVLSFFEKEVALFSEKNETLRYISLIPYSENEYWIVGKRQRQRRLGLKGHDYLVVWRGCNANLECLAKNNPEELSDWKNKIEANVAHNAAFFFWQEALWFIGGRDDPARSGRRGVYYFGDFKGLNKITTGKVTQIKLAFRGTHPGCIELRPQFSHGCEFDGRFSISNLHDGRLALYARANLAAHADQRGRFGARHLQVSFSSDTNKFPLWGPFALVSFLDYPLKPSRDDNIYFAAVKPNPIDDGHTVLGLFPVVSNKTGWEQSAAIALSISCDGQHFGNLLPIVSSPFTLDGRGPDHPVDGFHLASDHIRIFYQKNVPKIFPNTEIHDTQSRRHFPARQPTSIVALSIYFDWLHNATVRSVRKLSLSTSSDNISHRRLCADHPYIRRRRRPLLPAEEAAFYRHHHHQHSHRSFLLSSI
mmetsp:Transcript_12907/g.19334  ORF Transcript_12907/g.19334 Transcript_12907/m.19334 type:complete len:431 (-) Transcript_12907:190-1482(-)